jgi:hypothetical protein
MFWRLWPTLLMMAWSDTYPPLEYYDLRDRRVSGFRASSCRGFLVIKNPKLPNPDPSGSSDTCPRHGRLRSHREIAYREFTRQDFLVLENSEFPIRDPSGCTDTRPPRMDGLDPIGKSRIAVSHNKVSLYSKTPNSRFVTLPDLLTRILQEWTV